METFKVGQKRPRSPPLSLSAYPSHSQAAYTMDLVKIFLLIYWALEKVNVSLLLVLHISCTKGTLKPQ